MSEKIIKYTDDNLFTVAEITFRNRIGEDVTGTAFIDLDGRAWDCEHQARWASCTHKVCECGEIYRKTSWCEKCHSKKETERFLQFPTVEWDGRSPIFLKDCEKVFTDLGEIEDYCVDNDIKIEDLELCSAEIKYAYELDPADIYQDELYEGEVPSELDEIFDELNKKLKEKQIILSYWQQDERVILPQAVQE